MKILITGVNGQVGYELWRTLQYLGEIIPTTRNGIEVDGLPTIALDLANSSDIEKKLNVIEPDLICNAAAYTAVDDAESNPELAHLINVEAPAILAKYSVISDTRLVHYSTDYVFSGASNFPWSEHDECKPIGVYAKTKLQGEQAIIDSGCKHMIFRTAWIFSERGNNFLNTMLRLAKEKDELNIVDDQVGAPTWANSIAIATLMALNIPVDGLYHLTSTGKTSWCGYARKIFAQAEKLEIITKAPTINPIPTSQFTTAAERPSFSVLNCDKFQNTFDIKLPNWQTALLLCMQNIRRQN